MTRHWLRRLLRWLAWAAAIGLGLLLVLYLVLWVASLFMPRLQPVAIASTPNPARSYEEAIQRYDELVAEYKAANAIDPICLPQLLTHGEKTEHAIVLLHGLTACPYQYHELAQQYYDQGFNVFIPLLPHHGLADRLSNALADLSAEELMAAMDPAVDLAAGLGDQVTIQGISLGGNVAVAAGQLRGDLEVAMPISPAIGLRVIPAALTPAVARLLIGLPDIYVWWDPINKAEFQAASGYPGFSSHALGEIIRFGLALLDRATQEPPAAPKLLLVTNWGDPAVSLQAADQLAQAWRRHGGNLETYHFPLIPWLPHDIIATDAVGARIEETYPVLLQLVLEATGVDGAGGGQP